MFEESNANIGGGCMGCVTGCGTGLFLVFLFIYGMGWLIMDNAQHLDKQQNITQIK